MQRLKRRRWTKDWVEDRREAEAKRDRRHHKEVVKGGDYNMTEAQEARLKELEANTARTPLDEAEFNALLALDERAEELDDAKTALAAVQAGNTPPPPPDPVVAAQAVVDTATTNVANAQAVVDAAQAAQTAAANPPASPTGDGTGDQTTAPTGDQTGGDGSTPA